MLLLLQSVPRSGRSIVRSMEIVRETVSHCATDKEAFRRLARTRDAALQLAPLWLRCSKHRAVLSRPSRAKMSTQHTSCMRRTFGNFISYLICYVFRHLIIVTRFSFRRLYLSTTCIFNQAVTSSTQ